MIDYSDLGLDSIGSYTSHAASCVFYSLYKSIPTRLYLDNVSKGFHKNLPKLVNLKILYGDHYLNHQNLSSRLLIDKDNCLVFSMREYDKAPKIFYDYEKTDSELITKLVKLARKHQKRNKVKEVPKINLVVNNANDITTISRQFKYKKLNKEELEIHYGNKFLSTYDKLLNFLKEDKGLVLLYGEPGTGKSTIIKQLIADTLDDQILYLSPESINCIGSPLFTKFLINYPNNTLLAEDAECVLMKQECRDQATTNILNLTDGILSSVLSTKIIATFNTNIDTLDPALLRPGRLYLKYEFPRLSVEESNRFLEYYKTINKVNKDSTLAELFALV